MAGNHHGVAWHQTSEQAVRLQQSSYGAAAASTTTATTFEAARKRGRDADDSDTSLADRKRTDGPPAAKRLAAGLPSLPPRLTASAVVEAEEEEGGEKKGEAPPIRSPPVQLRGELSYSQRRQLRATPTPADDPLLSLAHPRYGLPRAVVANLEALGIRAIYPWQKQCLLGGGGTLLDGARSLVYAAPTGGGKSLVADVLMLRGVLGLAGGHGDAEGAAGGPARRRTKALLVLPFVALVQEKVRWLRRVVEGVGRRTPGAHGTTTQAGGGGDLRVVGFFGGAKIRAGWADFDIGVATIEKANALVNAAIDDCSVADLRVVVLDELHMVDDAHRGFLLELLATKLRCLDHPVQIVGMSATLNNISLLARWLDAYSYQTRYRPIPIEEHLVYDGRIYSAEADDQQGRGSPGAPGSRGGRIPPASASQEIKAPLASPPRPLRTIRPSPHKELRDPVTNAVVALADETARAGFGALVFASSRAAAESDALLISRVLPAAPDGPASGRVDADTWEARLDLLAELQSLGLGLDATDSLARTVLAGVGYHHAGMTAEERDLVARAYDAGVLKVCVATCGLAAGINLPARRVILHNARMGRELVGPAMLRQMRGRAGRKGKDELGETYLCCRAADVDDVRALLQAELPHVNSCLVGDDGGGGGGGGAGGSGGATTSDARRLQRALLEAIVVRLATSRATLDDYVRKTLLYHARVVGEDGEASENSDASGLWAEVAASLDALQAAGFVETDEYGHFRPTRLGTATVASALAPDDAIFLHGELTRALQAFVLDGEMHVLYTFTPVHDAGSGGSTPIHWHRFWEEMERLDESGLRVLRFLGLKPNVISRMLRGGTLKETTPAEKETARIYRRFYLALQLRDLCNEMPVHRVAQKYDTPRGAVQTLAQTCEGFAAGVIKFCEHMDWGAMASVLEHFVDRLKAGAKADLLALARIAFVKSRTARVFWENGFKTVAVVANADPRELVPVLQQAQAGKVRVGDDGDPDGHDEAKLQQKLLAKAVIITESANRIWQLEMQRDLEEE